MASQIPPDREAAIIEVYERTGSKRAAMRETGHDWHVVARVLKAYLARQGAPVVAGTISGDASGSPRELTVKESGDDAEVLYVTEERIRTIEDALRYGEVDTAVWFVDRHEIKSDEVVMKIKNGPGQPETPTRKTIWRVKLYLKRIMPKPFMEAAEEMFARMQRHSPTYPKFSPPRRSSGMEYMATFDLCDAHFGKLAWAPETGGENYDLKIAEAYYANAVTDLLEAASGFNVSKIVMPIGNDFFHIDNPDNTTTAGTPQSTDGRYPKIIVAGETAVINAVDLLMQVAPVELIYVPGNHDRWASFSLMRILNSRYRLCDRVTVNCEPTTRKHIHWGKNLIGFAHGDKIKPEALPKLLMDTWPHEYANSCRREWHCGHFHNEKRFVTQSVQTIGRVEIRYMHSLSATDLWHYDEGFSNGRKAADACLYSFDGNTMAQLSVNARAA